LAIDDDGTGGARPGQGPGLAGPSDRIEAPGGTLRLISPAGTGTALIIHMPVEVSEEARGRPVAARACLWSLYACFGARSAALLATVGLPSGRSATAVEAVEEEVEPPGEPA
jgi:hypothetical protein